MAFFDLTRGRAMCLILCAVCALSLFFGLFFGLVYPEIIRHGWPLTRCTVLDSRIDDRFCCEASCNKGCSRVRPSNAPTCRYITDHIDSQFTPQTCAANSSSCPALSGPCNGGYLCCGTCCSTCQSCSTSCSPSGFGGGQSCSTSCTSYECACFCCSSVDDLFCTFTCPTCYTVILDITYKTNSGLEVNTTYRHDSKKNHDGAIHFLDQHRVGTSSFCYYNPRNVDEVAFDVSFTAWKWAVSVIFGMVPLLLAISYSCIACLCRPFIARCRNYYIRRRRLRTTRNMAAASLRSGNNHDQGSGKETGVYHPGSRELVLSTLERKPNPLPVPRPADTDENPAQIS